MTVREEGVAIDAVLHMVEEAAQRIDDAARQHAETLATVARERAPKRTGAMAAGIRVEHAGPGNYHVIAPPPAYWRSRGFPQTAGQMVWLAGKTIPLTIEGQVIFRRVTVRSLAAGHWRYPPGDPFMADAAQDSRVQDVVAEQQRRLLQP